jgi:hypothetical protein
VTFPSETSSKVFARNHNYPRMPSTGSKPVLPV